METKTESQIEKPWCVYGYLATTLPEKFGKIVKDDGDIVNIVDSEQRSFSESWDIQYVKRFPTLEKAIQYFKEHKPEYDVRESPISESDIRRWAKQNFPSEYSQE